jgi:hypothetical protein
MVTKGALIPIFQLVALLSSTTICLAVVTTRFLQAAEAHVILLCNLESFIDCHGSEPLALVRPMV